jgi:hypothetical protein
VLTIALSAYARRYIHLHPSASTVYRKEPFDADTDRVALLFERYQALTA